MYSTCDCVLVDRHHGTQSPARGRVCRLHGRDSVRITTGNSQWHCSGIHCSLLSSIDTYVHVYILQNSTSMHKCSSNFHRFTVSTTRVMTVIQAHTGTGTCTSLVGLQAAEDLRHRYRHDSADRFLVRRRWSLGLPSDGALQSGEATAAHLRRVDRDVLGRGFLLAHGESPAVRMR